MSRHISRKQRWQRVDARQYTADLGAVVYERGAWHAVLRYHILPAPGHGDEVPTNVVQERRLGPFKRPRNAMLALEQEATILRNRLGHAVRFGE